MFERLQTRFVRAQRLLGVLPVFLGNMILGRIVVVAMRVLLMHGPFTLGASCFSVVEDFLPPTTLIDNMMQNKAAR